MKKMSILICVVIIVLISSCTTINDNSIISNTEIQTSMGNIQNGGYVLRYHDDYFYTNTNEHNNLYKYNININKHEKIAGEQFFYEMNLYNDEIYYISSMPGEVWKISVDGSSRRKLINQKVSNLVIYKNHMYYRLSEDNDWGKLYCTDLHGQNKKLLANKIKKFCIYEDKIYYLDIQNDNPTLCSMNIDGTEQTTINNAYTGNILAVNNLLIYSDYHRQGRLFSFNLESGIELCISEDSCWNLNNNQEWIFYRNQSDQGSLYCISFDGQTKRKLVDGNITNINVIDDYIMYTNINKQNKTEYIRH